MFSGTLYLLWWDPRGTSTVKDEEMHLFAIMIKMAGGEAKQARTKRTGNGRSAAATGLKQDTPREWGWWEW